VQIELLGTGSARGWPEPGCGCASCRAAAPAPRRPTEVLVDGALRFGIGIGSNVPAGWQLNDVGGTAVLMAGPLGQRLLYGVPTDSLPELATPLDAAFLLHGQNTDRALAELRRSGAVTANTLVVAVGLGHDTPPGELADLLWAWGVLLPRDGDVLSTPAAPSAGRLPRRTLVTGGSRSGKSQWAERQLSTDDQVTYVATGARRDDASWAQRIAAHRRRRPSHWQVAETLDIADMLASAPGSVLIDDLGNWVAATIDRTEGWDGDLSRYRQAADELVRAWSAHPGRVILVSNEVGSGVHPATSSGRLFSDEIGRLNAALAAESDEVVHTVAGLAQWLRRPAGMIVA
jgi:adenosylcobinamide kinase/adenosylcobinamide-phosphate guanylyltransferase